mmetsp:Transcript_125849/g.364126  ORF Transcript_125849/g.364126 Transcript_125849/m.364126 type:complete len:391 (-) Transcript_125849:96-1268(-)
MQSRTSMASMSSMQSSASGPRYNPDGTLRVARYNADGTLRDEGDEGARSRRPGSDAYFVPKYNPDGTLIKHDDPDEEEQRPLLEPPPGSEAKKPPTPAKKFTASLEHIVLLVAPTALRAWVVFLASSLLTTFCSHYLSALVIFGLLLGCVVAVRGMVNSCTHGAPARGLAFVVFLIAGLSGYLAGMYNYTVYMRDFFRFHERRKYANVLPDELAAAHADASSLTFADIARPDTRLLGAYGSGINAYCVAPIISGVSGELFNMTNGVQFWAVGRGCCRGGRFDCWSANNPQAHSGLVIPNSTGFFSELVGHDMHYYMEAIDMACAKYGVNAADPPMIVYWVTDPELARHLFVSKAWLFWFKAGILSLTVWVPLGAMVALVKSEVWSAKAQH